MPPPCSTRDEPVGTGRGSLWRDTGTPAESGCRPCIWRIAASPPLAPRRPPDVIRREHSVPFRHAHAADVFADEAAGAAGEGDRGEDLARVDVALGSDRFQPG